MLPNPIIWSAYNSPSKIFFITRSLLVTFRLCIVYAVFTKALPPKSFCLKFLLSILQITRSSKIMHYHGPKFEMNFDLNSATSGVKANFLRTPPEKA